MKGEQSVQTNNRRSRAARRRRQYLISLAMRCIGCALAAVTLVTIGTACFQGSAEQLYIRDDQAPSIWGARERQIYVGDTIAYREGVSVIDAVDPAPELTVDSSKVDLSTPGVYPLIYTATDANGNSSSVETTVTVLELPQGWATSEEIDQALKDLIQELKLESKTAKQQAFSIYGWCHENLKYGDHTDRANVQQAAYQMLTTRTGDCYGYFALSKALFEMLGIPNIDVVKVKNHSADSDHFWSLVSVDGGETYYHFDATPRVGQTESFCLITDEALDAYSAENKNSHNRNKELYPATPKEEVK